MPYSNAELRAIYTQLNMGSSGPSVDQAAVDAIAAQTRAGLISDEQALQAVFDLVDDTTGVAALTYQFFTGSLPSQAGFAFLVNSATNPNDLNDPYFAQFNAENRFINFALNLALGTPENQAAFAAVFGGSTSLQQAVALAYDTIIGNAAAEAAGVDVDEAVAFLTNSANVAFYRQIATGRGGIPATDAARLDLAIKAIAIAELLYAAAQSDVGNYASALDQFYRSLIDNVAGSPGFGNDLLETFPPTATVTLTANPDTVTGNVFNAPRVFTPGGDEQINSLNDDDVLTGVGTNPTLNLTFVNETENFDDEIAPTLNNIQTINVDFRTDDDATLDLQDATGVTDVNLEGIDDGSDVTIDNIQSIVDGSINDSNAPTSEVAFLFDEDAVEGFSDAATLTLNNAEVGEVYFQEGFKAGGEGVENLTIVSTGDDNEVGALYLEDAQKIVINGDEDLTIGTDDIVTTTGADDDLIEATTRAGGLRNVAGSLTLIDASALTGDLSINIDNVFDATKDGTSGTDIAVTVKGGTGNDTFYLHDQLGVNDTLTGSGGVNTLVMLGGSSLEGKADLVQKLEIRTDDPGTVTVDTSLLANLTDILVRNEGQNAGAAAQENILVNLTKLSSSVASTGGITVLHGTTGNNALTDTTIIAKLATDGANDTIVYKLGEGVNADPRFNVTFGSVQFENVVLFDNDSESNSVDLQEKGALNTSLTKSLVLKGGEVGDFLNLDTNAGLWLGQGGIYGFDVSGGDNDMSVISSGGRLYQEVVAPAQALTTATIDASGHVGNVILRVGSAEGQSITGGSGNDTFVFDSSNLRAGDLSTENAHAGLTNSDVVKGGAGTDRIALDGNHTAGITLQDSEWEGVSGIDEILIVGNTGLTNYQTVVGVSTAFNFNYRLDITDDLVDSTDDGNVIRILNDDGTSTSTTLSNNEFRSNANLLLDITPLNNNDNRVVYNGGEGGLTDVFLLADDSSFNGKHTIDGGDTNTAATNFSGNDNVIEIQNSATISIADWNGISNFDQLDFVNTGVVQQTLNLDLNDTVLDRLADSNHTATLLEREVFTINAYAALFGVQSNLVLNFSNVSGVFDINVTNNTTGTTSVVVSASPLTENDLTAGPGAADSFSMVGSSPGVLITDTVPGQLDIQQLDALGSPVGPVSDVNGFEIFDFSGYTRTPGAATYAVNFQGDDQTSPLTVTGSAGNDQIITGSGNDLINGGNGNDVLAGRDGNDTINGGEGGDQIFGGAQNDLLNGNEGNDAINGDDGNDIINGGDGNDGLTGSEGIDSITGGLGADTGFLAETTKVSDTYVILTAGESTKDAMDTVFGFDATSAATNDDTLWLPGTFIVAPDDAAADGINAGIYKSHNVTNGIISFDTVDAYTTAHVTKLTNLADAMAYVEANFVDTTSTEEVALALRVDTNNNGTFDAGDDLYVYQANSDGNTWVRLVGLGDQAAVTGISLTGGAGVVDLF